MDVEKEIERRASREVAMHMREGWVYIGGHRRGLLGRGERLDAPHKEGVVTTLT
jgi:hypothetical protein